MQGDRLFSIGIKREIKWIKAVLCGQLLLFLHLHIV